MLRGWNTARRAAPGNCSCQRVATGTHRTSQVYRPTRGRGSPPGGNRPILLSIPWSNPRPRWKFGSVSIPRAHRASPRLVCRQFHPVEPWRCGRCLVSRQHERRLCEQRRRAVVPPCKSFWIHRPNEAGILGQLGPRRILFGQPAGLCQRQQRNNMGTGIGHSRHAGQRFCLPGNLLHGRIARLGSPSLTTYPAACRVIPTPPTCCSSSKSRPTTTPDTEASLLRVGKGWPLTTSPSSIGRAPSTRIGGNSLIFPPTAPIKRATSAVGWTLQHP